RWWGSLPRGGYGEVSDDRRTPHARAGSPRVPPSGREGLRGDAPARRGLGRLRAGASRASSTASPKVSVGCVNRTAMTARWSICGSLQQYEIYSRCKMAKPDYRLCDICGEKTTATPIFAATDRVRDPSGNGYETEGSSFDLCQCHL